MKFSRICIDLIESVNQIESSLAAPISASQFMSENRVANLNGMQIWWEFVLRWRLPIHSKVKLEKLITINRYLTLDVVRSPATFKPTDRIIAGASRHVDQRAWFGR